MNTPVHLVIAAAAFAKPNKPKVTWAALAGGLIPDFSLYALAAWSLFIQGNSTDYVFQTQYFSDAWQGVFAVDNSFFVWVLVIAVGIWMKKHWLWALGGAGFLHLCLDFPLHHDDARPHFWPLSDWVFESPFSYWDQDHYGDLIGLLELGLCLVLLVVLWRRFKAPWVRSMLVFAALMQLVPVVIFSLFF